MYQVEERRLRGIPWERGDLRKVATKRAQTNLRETRSRIPFSRTESLTPVFHLVAIVVAAMRFSSAEEANKEDKTTFVVAVVKVTTQYRRMA